MYDETHTTNKEERREEEENFKTTHTKILRVQTPTSAVIHSFIISP